MSEKFLTRLSERKCFKLSENDTLKIASEKLQKHNIGGLPVLSTQDNSIIGIVSERDLARYIFNNEFKNDLPITKIMSKNLITCNLNTSITELMEIISDNKIRHIPIMEDKKLLGMVSIGDVLNYIIDQYKEENQHLRDFINK